MNFLPEKIGTFFTQDPIYCDLLNEPRPDCTMLPDVLYLQLCLKNNLDKISLFCLSRTLTFSAKNLLEKFSIKNRFFCKITLTLAYITDLLQPFHTFFSIPRQTYSCKIDLFDKKTWKLSWNNTKIRYQSSIFGPNCVEPQYDPKAHTAFLSGLQYPQSKYTRRSLLQSMPLQ